MIVGAGAFVSPEFEIADDVVIGAHAQLTGRGRIGSGVRIGHGAVIEGEALIGDNCQIGHHVLLTGRVAMGEGNEIGHSSTIGGGPDHPGHLHSDGSIEIGSFNVFRERCTVNMPTTEPLTRIGDHNYFMHGVHVAHDCRVGGHVKAAMRATLGGYVEVDDYTYLGMNASVHQRIHIGMYCMVGMTTAIKKHLPPFATFSTAGFSRVNAVGLQLRGFSNAEIGLIEAEYGFSAGPIAPVDAPDQSLAEIRRFALRHKGEGAYSPVTARRRSAAAGAA